MKPPASYSNHRQRITAHRGGVKIPHAIKRAEERYGLKLTINDLWHIIEQCKLGYGRQKFVTHHSGDPAEQHIVTMHGKRLVVIYRPPNRDDPKNPNGVVMTILPPHEVRSTHQYLKRKSANGYHVGQKKRMPRKARK